MCKSEKYVILCCSHDLNFHFDLDKNSYILITYIGQYFTLFLTDHFSYKCLFEKIDMSKESFFLLGLQI